MGESYQQLMMMTIVVFCEVKIVFSIYSIPQACVFSTTLIYEKDGDFRKSKWKPDRDRVCFREPHWLWAFTIHEEEWSWGTNWTWTGAYRRAQPFNPPAQPFNLPRKICYYPC